MGGKLEIDPIKRSADKFVCSSTHSVLLYDVLFVLGWFGLALLVARYEVCPGRWIVPVGHRMVGYTFRRDFYRIDRRLKKWLTAF